MGPSKVYIIVINWNGWKDTIECLESVFRNDYLPYTVVVCDNGSQDHSLEYIKLWADDLLDVFVPSDNPLQHFSHPPVVKPIVYRQYSREVAERGGGNEAEVPLVLIQTGSNLGFGGGNNVGLRYILAQKDAAFAWLLNNDTVISPDALSCLVKVAQSDPRSGAIGSTNLYYGQPEVINAGGGGMLRKYRGYTSHALMGKALKDSAQPNVPLSLDYVTGASCLLPVAVLRMVGLFDETFFHFWEDVDLGTRIINAGYKNVYEPASLIYHKIGVSVGGPSPITDYYHLRNTVIYYHKHFGLFGIVILSIRLFTQVIKAICRNQREIIQLLFKAFFHGFSTPVTHKKN